MVKRDEQGHSMPDAIPDEESWREEDSGFTPPLGWADGVAHPTESVFIETGRGQTAEVLSGSLFRETVERIADQAHYGGYFRVFLNGEEILNPEESPTTIEPGMRLALTSYDKVGLI